MRPLRSGYVAIVGRPNVGKSTLLNHLVGEKISIVSRKAQTTRHRITGIRTDAESQCVFVDTPGFQTKFSNALNRAMNRGVTQTLADVDVVVFVVEAGRFDAKDRAVLKAEIQVVINIGLLAARTDLHSFPRKVVCFSPRSVLVRLNIASIILICDHKRDFFIHTFQQFTNF